jgi:hypothetical protein
MPSWEKPECHRALWANGLTGQILKRGEINRPLVATTNPMRHLFDEESPACAKARLSCVSFVHHLNAKYRGFPT